jgi:hypothetical protein
MNTLVVGSGSDDSRVLVEVEDLIFSTVLSLDDKVVGQVIEVSS